MIVLLCHVSIMLIFFRFFNASLSHQFALRSTSSIALSSFMSANGRVVVVFILVAQDSVVGFLIWFSLSQVASDTPPSQHGTVF